MEKKENALKKIIHFLRRTHIFAMIFSIVWGAFVIAGALFAGYENYLIEIPYPVVLAGVIVVVLVSVVIQRRWNFGERNKKAIFLYNAWNYLFPAIVCAINFFFMDQLRSFGSGDMFAGLTALGYVLWCIFDFILSVLGCVIFNLSWLISKKFRA